MVLDSECVRSILLTVERSDFGEHITLSTLERELPNYTNEQLWYTCLKLEEGRFLDLTTFQIDGVPYPYVSQINCLTYLGHELIEKIRDSEHWSAVKSGLSAVRNYSLSAISSIAEGVTAAAINAYLSKLQ